MTSRETKRLLGPRTAEALGRGQFDMQAPYRTMLVDDAACHDVYLVDLDGNSYLDLFANFALGALGYNHPELVATAQDAAFVRAAVNPTSTPFLTTNQWLDFVDTLGAKFAPAGMSKVFCVDAGGEGVESALKAAFIIQGEQRRISQGQGADPLALPPDDQAAMLDNAGSDAVVVSFGGAFHGRGLGPLSATHSKAIHKADMPCFPWPQVPFPALRFPDERYAEENRAQERESLAELARVLEAHRGRVAAVLVEPMQSEGGDRHASPEFFRGAQGLASAADAAFILDEVQTGVGITGTLWAHEQFELKSPPDLVTFGKKMQLGGFFATPRFDIKQFGRMYQTRNGDRARGMLALTTLRSIETEGLLTNVRETGGYFLTRLHEVQSRHPKLVEQARGWGFLLAFDMPNPELRNNFILRCRERGVFVSYTGTRSVRMRPHLITRPSHVDEAVEVFDRVLADME